MEKLLVFIMAPLTKSLLHYLVFIGRCPPKNAFISLALLCYESVLVFRKTSSSCKRCRTRLVFLIVCVRRIRAKKKKKKERRMGNHTGFFAAAATVSQR